MKHTAGTGKATAKQPNSQIEYTNPIAAPCTAVNGPPPIKTQPNWAYLLRCADGTLYAGWTNDLVKRIEAHNAGTGAKYTRPRLPVQLAWAQGFATKQEAMRMEYRLKRMARAEKLALCEGFNPQGLLAKLK